MMEESENIDEIEDLDFCDGKPTGERWPPLGANDLDDEPTYLPMTSSSTAEDGETEVRISVGNSCYEVQRLRDLEEQQELLNSSLIALTSHFAQVQFRLRQIVDAPATEKEDLLKDLEVFAFRGIPEVCEIKLFRESLSHHEGESLGEKIIEQRTKQKELISQLKLQLEDLEKYAYETGEAGLPQCVILERQKVILDQLKGKLNLNVDDIDKLTTDDLRTQVDFAINQFVNPLKMKEHLVTQLKTQISDLERFIQFLQGDGTPVELPKHKECTCTCPDHNISSSEAATSRNLQGRSEDEV
uniref:(California timema) hypothetical protein n=1 Tax=Timema californicum TaxID=61474 RepID=A0A7R9PBB9_TIMCA|nr:unnamed protein product [Timema californicum]